MGVERVVERCRDGPGGREWGEWREKRSESEGEGKEGEQETLVFGLLIE